MNNQICYCLKSSKESYWIFIPYRRNITPSPSKEFRLPLEKGKYKVFSAKIHSTQPPFKTLTSNVSKENKIFTILIFVQIYNSKLWVNFGHKKLWISKNSKLKNYRYWSYGSSPFGLVSIGFLRREICRKYWSVLKSDFFFLDSTSLISFLIWSFQSWQSILAL